MSPFSTRTFGKWILSGEHTVLRGGEALVFPLKSQWLDWKFIPDQNAGSLNVVIPQGYPEEFKLLFYSVFEKACILSHAQNHQFYGSLEMRAQILVGSGLGASATLCVALTRWFQEMGLVGSGDAFSFAKQLEDVFHGESSGVDVAVVLSESGLIYKRNEQPVSFKPQYQPEWYLSHSGEKGITKECVNKVKALEAKDPKKFNSIDQQMMQVTKLCKEALESNSMKSSLQLQLALDMGRECFEQWGLVTPALKQHMDLLQNHGAIAMKPTGSGGGGFVLSLWDSMPKPLDGVTFLKASVN